MSASTRLRPDRASTLVYLVVFGAALLVRSWPFITGASMANIGEYDDGVYFSSAQSLWHGSWPYADFVLVHPPGIVLLLLPFAGLAQLTSDSSAFVVAHLMWMFIGAFNATLIAVLARRWGTLAALVAGLVYAVWATTVVADRTLNQAAAMNLLILLAVVALTRSRRGPLIAGVLLGLAMTVKIWAAIPFLLLAAFVLIGRDLRQATHLFLGGCAAATAVCLPFFVRAPTRMWSDVIETQAGRPNTGRSLLERSSVFFDATPSPGSTRMALIVLAVCAALVAPSLIALYRRRSTYVELDVLIAITVVELLLLGTSASFYPHYLMWAAPGLVLGAGRLVKDRPQPAFVRWSQLVAAGAVMVVLAGVALQRSAQLRPVSDRLVDLTASAHCVWSSESALLIQADVLSRDLAHGCEFDNDVYATVLSKPLDPHLTRAGEATERSSPSWQRSARHQFLAADMLLIGVRDRRELSDANLRLLHTHFTLIGQSGQVQVFERR
jgi:hypothetical protein